MPISKYLKRMEDDVQLADDTKFPWQPKQILHKTYVQIKECGIYKDECKEWLNKYEVNQTWDNFKTHFT